MEVANTMSVRVFIKLSVYISYYNFTIKEISGIDKRSFCIKKLEKWGKVNKKKQPEEKESKEQK